MSTFRLECFYNGYLARGATRLDAVVMVTAEGDAAAAVDSRVSEVLILDASGSMHGERLIAAKRAACAAIDCLRDGVHFAVIAGRHTADVLYPASRATVAADDRTRA